MTLPLLLSVPHAGLTVPPEATLYCSLSHQQVVEDSDDGASVAYDLSREVAAYVSTEVARAIVDQNRAEDDRSKDGAIKTHTCWDVPVYYRYPPEEVIEQLLARYHRPYHAALSRLASEGKVVLGIDCHTMAVQAPPIASEPGAERPLVCLSDGDGSTLPRAWLESLSECFSQSFECEVSLNYPFSGGYIIQTHAAELPWVQLELSRAPFLSWSDKRERVLEALARWCTDHPSR